MMVDFCSRLANTKATAFSPADVSARWIEREFRCWTRRDGGTIYAGVERQCIYPVGERINKVCVRFSMALSRYQPRPGFDEVLVPGDYEHRSRVQRLAHGIDVPDTTYQQILEWAERLNISLSEEIVEPTDVERYR